MPYEIKQGDSLQLLKTMPSQSIQTCVTSPPYWGLRDYGIAGQLGLEATPELYCQAMVEIFREVRRTLKDDGTLWLNLGDSYAGGGTIGRNDTTPEALEKRAKKYGSGQKSGSMVGNHGKRPAAFNLKNKDLVGIPWMLAFALRADGWYLRSDIIWAKPNPMPESVTDRPTKAHEYIFLLSKSEKYFYDAEAIKEPSTEQKGRAAIFERSGPVSEHILPGQSAAQHRPRKAQKTPAGWNSMTKEAQGALGRNKRSVWNIATRPFSEAHFATFPEEIPLICIKAGTKSGDMVLDPFNGAGTTGLVALKLGRSYTGIEINPEYIEISKRRIEGTLGTLLPL